MSQKAVRAGLERALKAWADAQSPILSVAWENINFTPPAGPYLRAFLLPVPTISKTLDRQHRRFAGVFQVDLVLPVSTGAGLAETLLDSLVSAFTPAAPIVESGVTIYITEPASASPALSEPQRYFVPVSISYEAHVS